MPPPSPAAGADAVSLDGVGLRYGRASEVLKDLSFSLPCGSFHFLTGRSGAGKTSLLSLLYLAQRPTRGGVTLFNTDLALAPREALPALRRRIGVVFQDMKLIEHLNVFENASLPLRVAGKADRARRADVAELLNWVGLEGRMDAYPETLSGGEKQRLALARAVVGRPDLILADEPTRNLDVDAARRMLGLLIQLNRQGVTVVVATHDQMLARGWGLPVIELVDGRLAA